MKWLAAAEGYEGTLLGFGNHDRGALHGRYLVLRQWLDARSVEVSASPTYNQGPEDDVVSMSKSVYGGG